MAYAPELAGAAAAAPAGGASSVRKPPSSTPPAATTSNNAPTAPGASPYDLSADPVLMQVQAQTTASNANAQAQALAQEQQSLLNYGDPALASAVLGKNDPYVSTIRAGDPESTIAQLGRQDTEALRQLDTTMDPSLVDSGYRVEQEGNLAQQYQDALAQAASAEQSQLQGYQSDLAAAEQTNNDTLTQAISDAYNRALAQQLAVASAGGTPDTSYLALLQSLGGTG